MNNEDDNHISIATIQAMHSWTALVMVVLLAIVDAAPVTRNISIPKQKLIWEDYISTFADEPLYIKRHLRMSLSSFYKLLDIIRAKLEVDIAKAEGKGGPILPELSLFCTLRWLAGGSYLDIYAITNVSIASFYRVVYRTLHAINNSKELQIIFPTTLAECRLAASGFRDISTMDAIVNCIGVIDGYLLRIYTPPKAIAGNVRSFFSGHYKCYGLNIQAVCDHNSRFTYFSVAAPGSSSDREALLDTDLPTLLEKVPDGFALIGDPAYEATEKMVPIYHGISKQNPDTDNFNYYASQCRIRIEMAFGLMQMKWGILWRPMRVKLSNIKHIILAIARLHNFIINERLLANEEFEKVSTGEQRVYCPSDPLDENSQDVINVENEINTSSRKKYIRGMSFIREEMVNRVTDLKLTRPSNSSLYKRKSM
jgi:hypothetical protein